MAAHFLVFGRSLTPPNADAPPAVVVKLNRGWRARPSAPDEGHVAQDRRKSNPAALKGEQSFAKPGDFGRRGGPGGFPAGKTAPEEGMAQIVDEAQLIGGILQAGVGAGRR